MARWAELRAYSGGPVGSEAQGEDGDGDEAVDEGRAADARSAEQDR